DGNKALFALDLDGFELPDTRETKTTTGGRHLFYRVPQPVKQGTNVLGIGVDTRSSGGFVLGPGSTIDGREYVAEGSASVMPAPDWFVQRCGVRQEREPVNNSVEPVPVDPEHAAALAIAYLRDHAPLAIEGAGGDETTYKVAARLKDMGVAQADALALLVE